MALDKSHAGLFYLSESPGFSDSAFLGLWLGEETHRRPAREPPQAWNRVQPHSGSSWGWKKQDCLLSLAELWHTHILHWVKIPCAFSDWMTYVACYVSSAAEPPTRPQLRSWNYLRGKKRTKKQRRRRRKNSGGGRGRRKEKYMRRVWQ